MDVAAPWAGVFTNGRVNGTNSRWTTPGSPAPKGVLTTAGCSALAVTEVACSLLASCRATLWMTTWTPRGVTVGDDGRLGLDPWQEESVASLA